MSAGGPKGEVWGRLLANKFVAGLGAELKTKVVGQEGSLDQLLLQARFEEAKRTELANQRSTPMVRRPLPGTNQSYHSNGQQGTARTPRTGTENAGNKQS